MTDNRDDIKEYSFPEGINEGERANEATAACSRIGYGFTAFIIVWLIGQIIVGRIIFHYNMELSVSMWGIFISNYVAMILMALPVLNKIINRLEVRKPQKSSLRVSTFLGSVMIMYTLSIAGSLIGIGVNYLINLLFGITSSSAAIDMIASGEDILANFLFAGITAPIVEEFIFRKLLIDRTIKYGPKLSLILSGLLFGLIHGNFQQFFYAFFLGAFFAYIYIRTGKLTYTIALHMILNSVSVIVAALYPVIAPIETMNSMEIFEYISTATPGILLQIFILIIMAFSQYIFAFIGAIILIIKRKSFSSLFNNNDRHSESHYIQGVNHSSIIFKNFGMILCIIISLAMFILNMIPV